MSRTTLEQVSVYAEQLLTVLVGDDTEAVTLQNVQEIAHQVAALRQKQLQQLKDDVSYLTSSTGLKSDGAASDSTTEDLAQLEADLKEQVEALQAQSGRITGECQHLKEQLAKAQSELKALEDQRQGVKDAKAAALPKARCDVNLYSNITNLRWQFQCEPHEVKGYICNNSDVKTFNLNTQQVSRFFITNYLWDLIEEDW
ncbi:hypothetical protein BaRGS_00000813 [Batillaria attramentaria]|uniref:Kinetochore protein Spc24 n=1 Tax=Batillaria attramentaria TaxID=370345 RepID=A0ABD0M7S6_9CAEN